MYCDKKELSALIRAWKRTKVMPPRLAEILQLIMLGMCKKYSIPADETQEAQQEFVLLMLSRRKKLDPSRNCFAYLTTTATNLLWLLHRKRIKNRFNPLTDADIDSLQE